MGENVQRFFQRPDPMSAEFVETIRQTLSSDTAVRDAAEKRYIIAKTNQPAATIAAFVQVIEQCQLEKPLRKQMAFLLKQCLREVADEGFCWPDWPSRCTGDVSTMGYPKFVDNEDTSARLCSLFP